MAKRGRPQKYVFWSDWEAWLLKEWHPFRDKILNNDLVHMKRDIAWIKCWYYSRYNRRSNSHYTFKMSEWEIYYLSKQLSKENQEAVLVIIKALLKSQRNRCPESTVPPHTGPQV